ncbi:hypothetical protein STCU_03355 [Strigomonas culicis]|uniref:EF-hand domain-containing protein n=1 Tax=Strigomonas culicis TaxID=28005 RepID=S9URW6_9TRYP|nr:hypothetical protein STCU_03355 [Strigomonas culicis]|eukprot:EPY31638.1 hypothetical protein STCU_03355 [Strigomonas culicis]
MGAFGKKPAQEATPPPADTLLNADDLISALDTIVNLGRPDAKGKNGTGVSPLFEVPFYCKKVFWDDWIGQNQSKEFQSFMESESFKTARNVIIRSFDMDGDGKVTPRDFQFMYDHRLKTAIQQNRRSIDLYLPFVGQCAFGVGVGLGVGALARNFYKRKYAIALLGFSGYSAVQYMAQQNFVNQSALEEAFYEKVKQMADVNRDGKIDRADLDALVENRIQYLATKLGPGGIAPGMAGYASLLLGFAKGVRIL